MQIFKFWEEKELNINFYDPNHIRNIVDDDDDNDEGIDYNVA